MAGVNLLADKGDIGEIGLPKRSSVVFTSKYGRSTSKALVSLKAGVGMAIGRFGFNTGISPCSLQAEMASFCNDANKLFGEEEAIKSFRIVAFELITSIGVAKETVKLDIDEV